MTHPRVVLEEPDAIASVEHYRVAGRITIQDADQPTAWIESDTYVPRDAIQDVDGRWLTPHRPYNTPDK